MQLMEIRPEEAEENRRAEALMAGTDIALRIEGVSKTFQRSKKREKKSRPERTWRERMSWRGIRERFEMRQADSRLKRVVDNVSLQARQGETLGILGPNGCGKSTLVRMISTLLIPDEGRISVFGLDVVDDSMAVKRLINRVSVDAAFFKKLSALENLLYTARLYDVPADAAMQKAGEILGLLGFDAENLENSMEQLSRGQQQKVAIARAFLTSPKMVLLDEPTTGLDPKSKKEVETFIRQLRTSEDITILLTTHDMAEAEALCDRIAILNKGKMVALGTAQALKALHRKPDTETLPTLEEVFIQLAGEKLEDADEIEDQDD